MPVTPPGTLAVTVTYLEMTAPPSGAAPPIPAPPGVALEPPGPIAVPEYRALYRDVGEAWLWYERLRLSDAELAALLADPGIEVRRLRLDGAVVGYSELDRRDAADVEIAYLGVVPGLVGRGLGRYLLAETLVAAWAGGPARVWLHTCTLDHPDAVAFYEAAGFRVCDTVEQVEDDPRALGLLPPDAGRLCGRRP